ncbi:DUF262 domain-containing protein [Paenibacillaceae sp. P-4]|uniref:GmrSD restriction endonuclease domain-containing protein n=1 Tax=Paenibacillaceae bacterium P-4 TaxID=3160969 RepID=UPI0032E82DA1
MVSLSKYSILHVERIGSVVYVDKGIYQISSIPQLLVIDGQQRLTTLTILMRAFAKVIEERNEEFEIRRSWDQLCTASCELARLGRSLSLVHITQYLGFVM